MANALIMNVADFGESSFANVALALNHTGSASFTSDTSPLNSCLVTRSDASVDQQLHVILNDTSSPTITTGPSLVDAVGPVSDVVVGPNDLPRLQVSASDLGSGIRTVNWSVTTGGAGGGGSTNYCAENTSAASQNDPSPCSLSVTSADGPVQTTLAPLSGVDGTRVVTTQVEDFSTRLSAGQAISLVWDATLPDALSVPVLAGAVLSGGTLYLGSGSAIGATWSGGGDSNAWVQQVKVVTDASCPTAYPDAGWSTVSPGSTTFDIASASETPLYRLCVRAVDAAGNVRIASQAFRLDLSNPTAVSAMVDGAGPGDIAWTFETSRAISTWTAATDSVSGVASYQTCVQVQASADGACDIATWAGASSAATFAQTVSPALAHDSTIRMCARAIDRVGRMGGTVCSDGVRIDVVAPSAPSAVRDGTSTTSDDDWTTSRTAISANWNAATDANSGIAGYEGCVSTREACGGADYSPWAFASTGLSKTWSGSRPDGVFTTVCIRAYDLAGLRSAPTCSNGQYDDDLPPVVSEPRDGASGDVDYTKNTTSATVAWDFAVDVGSAVASINWRLCPTGACTTIIASGTAASALDTSVVAAGLTLANGSRYVSCVSATDLAGNSSSWRCSDGVEVDTSPLDAISVADGSEAVDANWINTTTSVRAAATIPYLSGAPMATIAWATCTTSTCITGQIASTSSSLSTNTFTGLSLSSGVTYTTCATVTDAAGNTSTTACSNGQQLDTSAPVSPSGVSITAPGGSTSTIPADQRIKITFTAGSDTGGSSLRRYQYKLCGSTCGTILKEGTLPASTTAYLDPEMISGVPAQLSLWTEDNAGNISSVATSNSLTVTAPVSGTNCSPAPSSGVGTCITSTQLEENMRWTSSRSPYYLTGNVTIGGSATLRIEPGVTVALADGANLVIQDSATLIARGTAASPIAFIHDNVAHTATSTARSWDRLQIQSDSKLHILSYVQISYGGSDLSGGSGVSMASLKIGGGTGPDPTVQIDNLTISNAVSSGMYLLEGATVDITDSVIQNSGWHGVKVGEGLTAGQPNVLRAGPNVNVTGSVKSGFDFRVADASRRSLLFNVSSSGNSGPALSLSTISGIESSAEADEKSVYATLSNFEHGPGTAATPTVEITGAQLDGAWPFNWFGPGDIQPSPLRCDNGTDGPSLTSASYFTSRTYGLTPAMSPLITTITSSNACPSGLYRNRDRVDLRPLSPVKITKDTLFAAMFGALDLHGVFNSGKHGDPVNTFLGTFYTETHDLALPSAGHQFSIDRSYNSGDTLDGRFGRGWGSSLGVRLELLTQGSLMLHTETGRRLPYRQRLDGTFTPFLAGTWTSIVQNGSGYTASRRDGLRYSFDSAGKLKSVLDQVGSGYELDYTSTGALTHLRTTDGRGSDITTDASGRITSVRTDDGRSVAYTYDTDGQMTTFTDVRGAVTTYGWSRLRLISITNAAAVKLTEITYRGDGRVDTTKNAFSKVTTYGWNATTRVATTTDPAGKVWTHEYNALGQLNKSTDPTGRWIAAQYDASHNAVTRSQGQGATTTITTQFTYDALGRVATRTPQVTPGFTESWEYDPNGNVTKHVDGRGTETRFGYTSGALTTRRLIRGVYDPVAADPDADPDDAVSSYVRDGKGLLTQVTDPRGKITTFGYDEAGNLTSRTAPGRGAETWRYDSAGRMTSSYDARVNPTAAGATSNRYTRTYEPGGRMTRSVDPYGATETFVYDNLGRLTTKTDAAGQIWRYRYSIAGELVRIILPRGTLGEPLPADYDSPTLARTIDYAYDDRGLLISVDDQLGRVTGYVYDDAGRRTKTITPRGTATPSVPDDYTWQNTYDTLGLLWKVTDPAGGITETRRDALGRIDRRIDADGNRIDFTRDPNGNVTLQSRVDKVNTANVLTTWRRYDESDRVEREIQPREYAANGTSGAARQWGYDLSGNLTSRTQPTGEKDAWTYTDDNRILTWTQPRGTATATPTNDYQSSYSYDQAGNRTSVIDPRAFETITAYDRIGRVKSVQDANAHTTRYAYDDAGRLAIVTTADGATTSYGYDELGNRISRTDPLGRVTTWSVDAAGQIASKTTPGNRTWAYEWTPDGQLARVTDPLAETSTYTLDPVGRIATVTYSRSGTANTQNVWTAAGRLDTATTGSKTADWDYDPYGRPSQVSYGTARTFTYGYDANSNINTRTYPGGATTGYTWDASAQLDSITRGTKAWDYTYQQGKLNSIMFPNGTTSRWTWDSTDRIATKSTENSTAAVLDSYAVTRDPVGNPTTIARHDSVTEQFAYDTRDRITSACWAATCTNPAINYVRYGYDAVSNITSIERPGALEVYTHDLDDRISERQTTSGNTAYTYDAAGRMTARGSDTYTWDGASRMTGATIGATTLTYGFDGQGRRSTRTIGATTTEQLWDPLAPNGYPQVAVELDSTGAVLRDQVLGHETLAVNDRTNGWMQLHSGPTAGNITLATSDTQSIQHRRSYEPFGTTWNNTDATGSPMLQHGFAGETNDSVTGLTDLRARQYDPTTGQFLTRDPIEDVTGDPYGYANGNPVMNTDPSGLWVGALNVGLHGDFGFVEIGGSTAVGVDSNGHLGGNLTFAPGGTTQPLGGGGLAGITWSDASNFDDLADASTSNTVAAGEGMWGGAVSGSDWKQCGDQKHSTTVGWAPGAALVPISTSETEQHTITGSVHIPGFG